MAPPKTSPTNLIDESKQLDQDSEQETATTATKPLDLDELMLTEIRLLSSSSSPIDAQRPTTTTPNEHTSLDLIALLDLVDMFTERAQMQWQGDKQSAHSVLMLTAGRCCNALIDALVARSYYLVVGFNASTLMPSSSSSVEKCRLAPPTANRLALALLALVETATSAALLVPPQIDTQPQAQEHQPTRIYYAYALAVSLMLQMDNNTGVSGQGHVLIMLSLVQSVAMRRRRRGRLGRRDEWRHDGRLDEANTLALARVICQRLRLTDATTSCASSSRHSAAIEQLFDKSCFLALYVVMQHALMLTTSSGGRDDEQRQLLQAAFVQSVVDLTLGCDHDEADDKDEKKVKAAADSVVASLTSERLRAHLDTIAILLSTTHNIDAGRSLFRQADWLIHFR